MVPCVMKAWVSLLLIFLGGASASANQKAECHSPDREAAGTGAVTMLAAHHTVNVQAAAPQQNQTKAKKSPKQIDVVEETSSSVVSQTKLEDIHMILFITTHLSDNHLRFFRECWPGLLNNSVLLRHADVLLFTSEEPPQDIIQDVFHDKNVRVERYMNPGYERGAMLAMETATTNDWFNGYDWMIRLNPDVLILEDEWLIKNMLDSEVDGIFADCLDHQCFKWCSQALINSDFFAVRPKHLVPESIPPENASTAPGHFKTAEFQVTAMFRNLVRQGRDRWLPGTHMAPDCRVRGPGAPVLHAHSVVDQCPLAKGQPEDRQIDFEFLPNASISDEDLEIFWQRFPPNASVSDKGYSDLIR